MRRAYDRQAPSYDERFSELQRPKHQAILERADLARGALVLDVGSGTGLLAARLGACRVVALDLSLEMLRQASARAARIVQGDALELPFVSGSFDAAFAITALLVPARVLPRALVELHRVLVPGGLLAITLLQEDVPPGFDSDLRASGFAAGASFTCGQDRGWIARRA